MLDEKLVSKLNDQLTNEYESGYIYLAMASYLEHHSYDGFSTFMKEQVKEEIDHGMRFYNYLHEQGVQVRFGTIKEPTVEFTSVLDVFEKALAHEKLITKKIHELAEMATELKDQTTISFLQWFIDEQVEEEASFQKHTDNIRQFKDDQNALSHYDQELGKRVFTAE